MQADVGHLVQPLPHLPVHIREIGDGLVQPLRAELGDVGELGGGLLPTGVEREALRRGRPEIFNSDQGCQFTSPRFTSELEARGIVISMDGRGRYLDNIFIERLWRSLKYEEVYLKDYRTVGEAEESIGRYFEFYNQRRIHQSLGYRTPAAVHAAESSTTAVD